MANVTGGPERPAINAGSSAYGASGGICCQYSDYRCRWYHACGGCTGILYAGASAVEVGMQNFIDPLCCVKIIEDLPKVLKKYGNNSLNDAVGRSFR